MCGAKGRRMSTIQNPRTNIVAAIDYSEFSAPVVEQAIAIARRCRPSEVHFLHVNRARGEDEEGQEGRRFELLEWLGARLPAEEGALDGVAITAHEAIGEPWQVITKMAADLGSDLVILGTHGRKGLDRLLMGSVAEAVSRECTCSVYVVRRHPVEDRSGSVAPGCPLCVDARIQSQGSVRWCADHAHQNGSHHALYDRGIARWLRDSLFEGVAAR
jgi:nucleotide-binding universal stress UspA family protein